jgi:hypothetical protein
MVVSLLRSTLMDLLAFRSKNVVNTLTIGCMQPADSEGAAALTCELVFNSDYQTGLNHHNCATHCLMCKNNQERKGHQYPPPSRFYIGSK